MAKISCAFADNLTIRNIIGNLNMCGSDPYSVPNGYNTSNGCLTKEDSSIDYGGNTGWTTNMGLLMECLDTTEITVHDFGTCLASLI